MASPPRLPSGEHIDGRRLVERLQADQSIMASPPRLPPGEHIDGRRLSERLRADLAAGDAARRLSHINAPLTADDDASSPLSSIHPHLDTLFAEFSRTRSRLSLSPPRRLRRTHSESVRNIVNPPEESRVDLRSLEYVSDYDPHLMCPICHVPFIAPIVLECDHTFCASCYQQYRQESQVGRQDQCPSCRTEVDARPKKASRLILNMCHDLRVRCPNEYCEQVLARGCVEQHVFKDCVEQKLDCPDPACTRTTKRRNFEPDRCLHTTHVECDCGELIELGRGEWLQHKDNQCPKTATKCEKCGERLPRSQSPSLSVHICRELLQKCPGADFGCDERGEPDELDAHAAGCAMAKMAPFMQKQARMLASMQEQLTQSQVRNDVLETGLDRAREIIGRHERDLNGDSSADSAVEEIVRTRSPSPDPTGRNHAPRHDLLLPAHLRALTPSPDPSSQQHLLALHEALRQTVTNLEQEFNTLSAGVQDLDARTSMQLMNETLRIKEDLAHTNAALFSTRAQVQWLLNRERAGQQMGVRGRTVGGTPASDTTNTAVSSGSTVPAPVSSPPNEGGDGIGTFTGFNTSQRGPSRRPSGGSQERVKL